jgi:hypothetical protein
MSPISIPDSAYDALRFLAGLTEDQFSELLSVISKSKPEMSSESFARHVASCFNDEEATKVKRITRELFRIEAMRDNVGLSPKQLGDAIVQGALDEESNGLSLPKESIVLLGERITKIYECSYQLSVTAKVLDVATEHTHVFLSARTFTDIRPVFTADATSIDAAVLVHHLVIHYLESGEHRDFNVALDTKDIQSLRESLDRADKKANLLRELVNKSNVAYVQPES